MLVIRRTGQTWTIQIGKHMHGLHDLRIVRLFLANARQQFVLRRLRKQRRNTHKRNQAKRDGASIQHRLSPERKELFKSAGIIPAGARIC